MHTSNESNSFIGVVTLRQIHVRACPRMYMHTHLCFHIHANLNNYGYARNFPKRAAGRDACKLTFRQLKTILFTVNNNTFCFATIDKVFYYAALILGHHQVKHVVSTEAT
jgi:hypothetical protein